MASRLIVFDFDGTLIDSRADLATAVNLVRADYGLAALPVATVTQYIGDGVRKLLERALAGDTIDIPEAIGRMRGHYAAHLVEATTLYPGAAAALRDIVALGYRLAIVSNKPEEPTKAICRHFGIDSLFSVILGGDSCRNLKPHPEPLLLCLERTGCAVEGSWIVGDNHTDMAAGRNAGFARCYCTFGFGQLKEETYDLAVDSLGEFAAHLRRAGKAP